MGTPAFALPTLKALQESTHEIVAVYTQPPRPAGRGQKDTPSPIHQFALAHGLKVYMPVSLKPPEAHAEFAAHKAEVAVVVAYGLLLPKPVLESYPRGCINVHPSKLPRWRGAAPIQRTIMAGDKETAICIMQMDEGLDTGDILLQKNYPIAEGTTAGQLHDLLAEEAGALVLQTLEKCPVGVKQSASGVKYAKKISKDECHIRWDQPAKTIYHHILGLSPSPGATFTYNNEMIKIFDASYDSRDTGKPPGTLLDNRMGIACNPGLLYPTEIQRAGKKRMSIAEFINSFHFTIGDQVN